MRGASMNYRNLSPEERFDLIMECRNSGLSDHQWLENRGMVVETDGVRYHINLERANTSKGCI